jgi:class 3 adenylate cyclase
MVLRSLKAKHAMAEERVQRRLAAILAADVVGYSRLMEQDEAGTMATLKERRKSIVTPLVGQHHETSCRRFRLLGASGSSTRQSICVGDRGRELDAPASVGLPVRYDAADAPRGSSTSPHRRGIR